MHKAVETWNNFVEKFIESHDAWNEHRKEMEFLRLDEGARALEVLPPAAQRFLRLTFNTSKFEVAIPRMVDYMRGIGGIETLRLSLEEELEEEPEEEPEEEEPEDEVA